MNWKEELINKIKSADIKVDDWYEYILEQVKIPDYSKGYIDCYIVNLNECLFSDSEDYREDLLKVIGYF